METFRQAFPTQAPPLTEKNLPDQAGKVFLITGASAGIGAALAKMLFAANAKVYVGARSEERGRAAIEGIKAAHPTSKGELVFLALDLADLSTIRRSAEAFLAAESRLNVLWLNAGVMAPPAGSTTAQGFEMQLGVNNLGHFLLAQCLRPALTRAAADAPQGAVRVVWVSSSAADMAPKPPVDMTNVDYSRKKEGAWAMYARSKAGNVLHAAEFARRFKDEGLVSVSLNPGNLKSDLQRHMPSLVRRFISTFILHPVHFGAYTEMYAGLSPDIGAEQTGVWVQPWGRLVKGRKDLWDPELGAKYWQWSEEQTQAY